MELREVNIEPGTGDLVVTWSEQVIQDQVFETVGGRRIPIGRAVQFERTLTERAQQGTPEFDALRLRVLTEYGIS